MVVDVVKLINCIQLRGAIWDVVHPQYRNRDLIRNLWKEVAAECGTTIDIARRKWRHLRNHFSSEHKKSTVKESTWVFYKTMLFLKDQSWKRRANLSHIENQEEIEFDLDEEEEDGYNGTEISGFTNTSINKESHEDSSDSELLNMERKDINQLESPKSMDTRKETDDDIDYFLKSLHRPISQLPLTRQMYLRVQIQELMYNEFENQSHSQYTHPIHTNPPSNSLNTQ